MRVALVHDWLTGMRGGEKVLEVLCEIFPKADLHTLLHIPGSTSKTIESREIKTSFVQNLPRARKSYRAYLPLFPMAIESFDLRGYDLIISTSHCVAKGVIPPPGALHISYIHTPMRYVWDMYHDYFGGRGGLERKAISLFCHYLRAWDASSSNRVDCFIANSGHVAGRIRKYYRREASVIHPPVDCSRFSPGTGSGGGYYLVVSAFAPYKRLDIAIEAFNKMGKRLVVIGSGQDEKRLRNMAGPGIEFTGWKDDGALLEAYRGCMALIFPGEEDFGITPLEAMACGKPVIAYGRGGALETIVPLKENGRPPTGIFFSEQKAEALVKAVEDFEESARLFETTVARARSLAFDRPVFKEKLKDYIFGRFSEFASGRLRDAQEA